MGYVIVIDVSLLFQLSNAYLRTSQASVSSFIFNFYQIQLPEALHSDFLNFSRFSFLFNHFKYSPNIVMKCGTVNSHRMALN